MSTVLSRHWIFVFFAFAMTSSALLIEPLTAQPQRAAVPFELRLQGGDGVILRYESSYGELAVDDLRGLTLTADGRLEVRLPEPLATAGLYVIHLSERQTEELAGFSAFAVESVTTQRSAQSLSAGRPGGEAPGRTPGTVGWVVSDRSHHRLQVTVDQARRTKQDTWRPYQGTLEWLDPITEDDPGEDPDLRVDDLRELQRALEGWIERATVDAHQQDQTEVQR